MVSVDFEKLAIRLAKVETEEEVILVLQEAGLWNCLLNWQPFGKNENNFSTIGNQQSSPDAAFVEKVINAVDAVLMKECLIRGINPESEYAPKSIQDALIKFFKIRDGRLSNLDVKSRNTMSNDISIYATGTRSNPNYTIVDVGEGQTPQKMPDTILSLGKSNKLRVPFVQGKFNMGGTGVFQFCGKENIQLIITKRCPDIIEETDATKDYYGLTVIRRENPSNGRRSSIYTYLTNNDGSMIKFKSESLKVVPDGKGDFKEFKYGMFIKMFDYSLPGKMKTNIVFDLNYRLSLLMPGLAHPIRLVECRDYKGHTLESTLSGLNVRLDDDRSENLEPEFPTSFNFNIEGQPFSASIYVFKENLDEDRKDAKRRDEKYRNSEGIIFTLNGQTHGSFSKAFFSRSTVGLSYISDSVFVVVDCSKIDGRTREDLFMNSRDRLRDGELKKQIESNIEYELKHHAGLRALQEERRRKAIANKLQDQKPLADVLKDILKKSPTLSTLFIAGSKLQNPFNLIKAKEKEQFIGKQYPTYFIIKNKPVTGHYIKHAPINHTFRVQFETDARNDYLSRADYPGVFEMYLRGIKCSNYMTNIHNGIITLSVIIPKDAVVGDLIQYDVKLTDTCTMKEYMESFIVQIEKAETYEGSTNSNGIRKKPSDGNGDGNREKPAGLALPNVWEIYQTDWYQYNLTKEDALFVKGNEDSGFDFYINMDNIHLKTEQKGSRDATKVTLLNAQYKYSMVLIGLSIINHYKNNKSADEDFSIEETVKSFTRILSPIIIPMIESMGELDINDIEDVGRNAMPA